VLSCKIAKENDERLHQEELTWEQRRHQNSMRNAEERNNSTLSTAGKVIENQRSRLKDTQKNYQQQMELDRSQFHTMMENVKRQSEEAERRHQEFMRKLQEGQDKQGDTRPTRGPRKKTDNDCKGNKAVHPKCYKRK